MAVCRTVGLSVAVCRTVGLSVAVCRTVGLSVAVCRTVGLSMAVCGGTMTTSGCVEGLYHSASMSRMRACVCAPA